VRVGVVSIEKLKEIRPYVIVGAFVIGAIFTPPDVILAGDARGALVVALRASASWLRASSALACK